MNSPLQRLGRWIGKHLVLIGGLLVIVYMFVPIAVVVLMSFNKPDEQADLQVRRVHAATTGCNPCKDAEHVLAPWRGASRSACSPRSSPPSSAR